MNGARAKAVLSAVGVVLACWLFIRPIHRVVENVGFHFTRRPPPAYGGVFDVEPSPPTGSTKVGAALPAWSSWQRVAVSARGAMVLNDADSLVRYALVTGGVGQKHHEERLLRPCIWIPPHHIHHLRRRAEYNRGLNPKPLSNL